jgi:hypothetical protein
VVGYLGRMGGLFSSLGWEGLGIAILGGLTGGYAHGYITDRIARYLMPGEEEPDVDTLMKADGLSTLILAGISLIYGVYRMRTMEDMEESDMLDSIGNFLGGILLYESGNAFELVSQYIGKVK